MPSKPLSSYLKAIPSADIVDIVADLLKSGFPPDDVRAALPVILDELIPLGAIPGAGPLLEAADGPVLKAIVDALWPVFQRKAERKNRTVRATVSG